MTENDAGKIAEELERIWKESVLGGITIWGQALVKARENASAPVWEATRKRLEMTHKAAEIDSAIAVGEGRLDPALFPDGVTHSKVLSLNSRDQQRLLSGERFDVYEDLEGSVQPGDHGLYSWLAMTAPQRNRLLSAKGGRILSLAEQTAPRRSTRIRVGTFVNASYRPGDGHVTLRNGTQEARISLTDLADTMGEKAFDTFVSDMNRLYGRD